MEYVYEDKRIPLQIRRLLIFDEICRKAKRYPDEIVYFSAETQLAFGVIYFERTKKYIAYGGVFEYSYMLSDGTKQNFDVPINDDLEMCEISIKKRQFTKSVNTPIELWWRWNKHVKKQFHAYLYHYQNYLIQIDDETDLGYRINSTQKCLLASAKLPLWNNMKRLKS